MFEPWVYLVWSFLLGCVVGYRLRAALAKEKE